MELLPAELRGPRLALWAWSLDDVDALSGAVIASVDHLLPWMHWAAHEPMDRETRRQLIERWQQERTNGGDSTYGMFEDGVVVGSCGLHRRRGPDEPRASAEDGIDCTWTMTRLRWAADSH